MDREAWQATVHGVAQSQTRLSEHTPHQSTKVSGYKLEDLWQGTNYGINLKQISEVIFCDNLTLIILIQYNLHNWTNEQKMSTFWE